MRNEKIGRILREARKSKHLKVYEVSGMLNEQYGLKVAEKTIYGWESNQARPTVDTFLKLCEIYQIRDMTQFLE